MRTFILTIFIFSYISCSSSESEINNLKSNEEILETPTSKTNGVTKVTATGKAQNYTFNVTIKSPDTGCQQYADWWEVLDKEGNLIYRRILAHSHVNEQPFTRSGGKVTIDPNTEIIVRAHMNNSGYLPMVFTGTVASGFTGLEMSTEKIPEAAKKEPLPSGCAF